MGSAGADEAPSLEPAPVSSAGSCSPGPAVWAAIRSPVASLSTTVTLSEALDSLQSGHRLSTLPGPAHFTEPFKLTTQTVYAGSKPTLAASGAGVNPVSEPYSPNVIRLALTAEGSPCSPRSRAWRTARVTALARSKGASTARTPDESFRPLAVYAARATKRASAGSPISVYHLASPQWMTGGVSAVLSTVLAGIGG